MMQAAPLHSRPNGLSQKTEHIMKMARLSDRESGYPLSQVIFRGSMSFGHIELAEIRHTLGGRNRFQESRSNNAC